MWLDATLKTMMEDLASFTISLGQLTMQEKKLSMEKLSMKNKEQKNCP
ncbi:hypothetical protein [Colwellia sp. Arc7-635]|jgi:hypothetical protein|nr:hypothetical protein [Colwellia sp. Arc7-635]